MPDEDISEFIDNIDVVYTFYNKDGIIVEDEVEGSCAYIATVNQKVSYWVKTFRNSLFDPQGMDASKINSIHAKFTKTNKESFDYYVKYLTNKQRNDFTWASRGMIDV